MHTHSEGLCALGSGNLSISWNRDGGSLQDLQRRCALKDMSSSDDME